MSTQDLFGSEAGVTAPLAARLRPTDIVQFFGQLHLLGPGAPLQRMLASRRLHSMILWGPPGVGKTTLAKIFADVCGAEFTQLSAVSAGVRDVRDVVALADARRRHGIQSVLFLDEVHRFNKAQQDALLPHVEAGVVTLIGATTENPSFEVNNALLSRTKVYRLEPLSNDALAQILDRALSEYPNVRLAEDARRWIITGADGDGRRLLNLVEALVDAHGNVDISFSNVQQFLRNEPKRFDKRGDSFFDQVSALHKAVRGSAPDAALYWLARMLTAGCDPLYVARRVVRMASEDIGMADPAALRTTLDAWDVQQRLGSPEGELALAQAVVYLATAPKSNSVYLAWQAAVEHVTQSPSVDVPLHLRNAPTALMREFGHGADYRYAHDEPSAFAAGESYLAAADRDVRFYDPSDRGYEAAVGQRMERWRALDAASAWQRYEK